MNAGLINFDWLFPGAEASVWMCWLLIHSLWVTAVWGLVAWTLDRTILKSVHWKYCVYVLALLASILATPIVAEYLQPKMTIVKSNVWSMSRNAFSLHAFNRSEAESESRSVAVEQGGAGVAPTTMPPRADEELPSAEATQTDWTRFAPWVVLVYATGVLIMCIRLLIAIWSTHRLRSRARPLLDGPVFECAHRLAVNWGMRTAKVAEVTTAATPIIVGLLTPTILVPASILSGLNATELEMVLRHELAHIRRRDVWVQLFQRIAEAALFFNPSVWLISRRISRLREYCCDEIACSSEPNNDSGLVASNYAAALLAVAEMSLKAKKTRLVGVAATGKSPSELRRRIQRVFGEPVDPVGFPPLMVGLASLLLMGMFWLPAWADSEPLESLKQLETPILAITMEGGNANLQELAEPTGGKDYQVQNSKALSRIVERENQAISQLTIDSRLLEKTEPEVAVAKPTPPAEPPKDSAIQQAWQLVEADKSPPRKNPDGKAGRREVESADVFEQVEVWARRNAASKAQLTLSDAKDKPVRWFLPDKTYELESFHVESTNEFISHMKEFGDKVANEPGFSADVLDSVKSDPNGPKVDLVELFGGFGKRVVFVRNKETGIIELLGWELDDPAQVRKGMAQLLGKDPDVTPVNAGHDVAWVTLGPQAASFAISGKWLMVTHNAKIAKRLILLAGPRSMDHAMDRVMLKDLQKLVESNRGKLEAVRKKNASGVATSRELFAADAAYSDSQGQLYLVEGKVEKAIESFENAVNLHQLLVRAKREQYKEGALSFRELNAAIEKRFVASKKLEEAQEQAAAD